MWQITMSAAFGCKGVIWFRLYDRDISPNYHGSPIDEYGYNTIRRYACDLGLYLDRQYSTHVNRAERTYTVTRKS